MLRLFPLRRLWRRSGQLRQTAPAGSRFIERLYAERYAPFLCRGQNAALVLGLSATVAVVFGYYALQLQPAAHDVKLWPEWHNAYKYLDINDAHFELAKKQVTLVPHGLGLGDRLAPHGQRGRGSQTAP